MRRAASAGLTLAACPPASCTCARWPTATPTPTPRSPRSAPGGGPRAAEGHGPRRQRRARRVQEAQAHPQQRLRQPAPARRAALRRRASPTSCARPAAQPRLLPARGVAWQVAPTPAWTRRAPRSRARRSRARSSSCASLAARYDLRHAERTSPRRTGALPRAARGARLARDDAYTDALLDPFVADDQGAGAAPRGGARDPQPSRRTSSSSRATSATAARASTGSSTASAASPTSRIVWGNHDAEWMGACLGQEALIATVLRISLRYRRLAQLEEGYGITIAPLEQLARTGLRRRSRRALPRQGRGPARPAAAGAHAEGDGHPAVQARGPDQPPQPAVRPRAPQPPAPHRSRAPGTVTIDGKAHPLLDTRLAHRRLRGDPYASRRRGAGVHRAAPRSRSSTAPPCGATCASSSERGSMLAVPRPSTSSSTAACRSTRRASRSTLAVDGEPRAAARSSTALERVVRRAFRERRAGRPRHALVPVDRAALAALRQGPHGDVRDVLRRRQGDAQGDEEPVLRR